MAILKASLYIIKYNEVIILLKVLWKKNVMLIHTVGLTKGHIEVFLLKEKNPANIQNMQYFLF